MELSRTKKILYYIGRNLLVYALMLGITHLSLSMETKRPGEHNYAGYYIITVFYVWAMLHNSLLFEKLLTKKRYVWYALSIAAGYALMFKIDTFIMEQATGKMQTSLLKNIFLNTVYTCIALVFYLAYKYVVERKKFFQLKIMQRDIELQNLKAHLNPHFLFNALNNIYSYTLQHNRFGDELILKLSELMRFILDNSEKENIKVRDELNFIANYILFEKERLGERCTINFSQVGNNDDRLIAPLILFPFIENACKYGADTIQRTTIDILIENMPGFLKLTVKNSVINTGSPSTKTGLQNAIRRLELLYPEKHEVLITTDNNTFRVELILRFNEN